VEVMGSAPPILDPAAAAAAATITLTPPASSTTMSNKRKTSHEHSRRTTLITTAATAPITTTSRRQRRQLIINGIKAPAHRYPYFVLLNGGDCGGSLIAPDIVLTAGHCLPIRTLDRNYTHDIAWARVGIVSRDQRSTTKYSATMRKDDDYEQDDDDEEATQDFLVKRAVRHSKFRRYGDDEFRFDYTIVQLDGSSTLPFVSLLRDESILEDYPQVTALGLGWTKPDRPSKANWLHQVDLTWIPNNLCAKAKDYDDDVVGDGESYHGRIHSSHFCTFEPGKDSCAFDSGSPLIITTSDNDEPSSLSSRDDYLVAQVSWGMECADEIFPAVNARVSTVLDWIDDIVCDWSVNPPAEFGCVTPSPTNAPTTTSEDAWNFSSFIPLMGNADFLYVLVTCLLAACVSRMYWRRRRFDYEALK
jgi:secreted trypsin-like serine protease